MTSPRPSRVSQPPGIRSISVLSSSPPGPSVRWRRSAPRPRPRRRKADRRWRPSGVQIAAGLLYGHTALGRRLQDSRWLMIGKAKPERLGSRPTKASKNAGHQEHNLVWGGQHGYFAILADRSADYFEIDCRNCCGAILITVHHQSPWRNAG